MDATVEQFATRLRTATVWTNRIEVLSLSQECGFVWMLLAFDWKAIVNVAISLQLVHKRYPYFLAFTAIHERVCIANHDQTISRSRK
jgi:hypothetical protein